MTDKSLWMFLRRTVYDLKRQYNVEATVYKVLDSTTDYVTGGKTGSYESYLIPRIIMFPIEELRKVPQGIAQLSANKFFVSQAGFDKETALFVIDANDLPTGFQFNFDDFIVVEDKYYQVIEVDVYESAWVIKTSHVKGSKMIPFAGNVHTLKDRVSSDAMKWAGGVLANNGSIYGIPDMDSAILKINSKTKAVSTFGNVPYRYMDGVIAANGLIYSMPLNTSLILKINPVDDTFSFAGIAGPSFWQRGTVLALNGCIYGVPAGGGQVVKIDPTSDTISQLSGASPSNVWVGGVLAPNGCIYGIPYRSSTILKIDTTTDTLSEFGSFSGGDGWSGGVLAPNGYIYAMPCGGVTEILKIDPSNDTTSTFGNFPTYNNFGGAVLGPDGCIYGIPLYYPAVLRIDPSDDSISFLGNLPEFGVKWQGGVHVSQPRDLIFGIPASSSDLLWIN